jgi:intracellular septation protein
VKGLLDFLPVITFAAVYLLFDLYYATAAMIGATVIQAGYSLLRHRRIEKMLLVNLAVVAVFGGMALVFRDAQFMVFRASVMYWIAAIGLLLWYWVGSTNAAERLMGGHFEAPPEVWRGWLYGYVAFLAAMGVLNLFVGYTFSEPVWVAFDTFGAFGIIVAFLFLHFVSMRRYARDGEQKNMSVVGGEE